MSIQINPAEDPETIQEVYDELVGIYEWNSNSYDWDYTDAGDKIVFMFPSEQDGTSNNAKYTVSYTGYTGPNPLKNDADIDYDGDLRGLCPAIAIYGRYRRPLSSIFFQ